MRRTKGNLETEKFGASYDISMQSIRTGLLSTKGDEKLESKEHRSSQWENLLRKFSEAHKEECKSVSVEIPRAHRSAKTFPTGSQYEGTWNVLGMSGRGVYTFPNGVIYQGEFDDGLFHGDGELRYPSGAILRGRWKKGDMVERRLFFADGLEYSEIDWEYCKMPDRRFTIEYNKGLQPAGKSFMTADQPTREIPPGFYDTVDGFYDPKNKVVYKADDPTAILRSPSLREQKWIIENCRHCPEEPLGPRPDLYEEWSEPCLQPRRESRTPSHLLYSASQLIPEFTFDIEEELEIGFKSLEDTSEDSSASSFSVSVNINE